MKSEESGVPTLAQALTDAAAQPADPQPLRIQVKGHAALTRHGEALGELDALLRLSKVANETPTAAIALAWPHDADDHPVVTEVRHWAAIAGDAFRIDTKSVDRDGTETTQLEIRFAMRDAEGASAPLLLLDKLGLGKVARAKLPAARAVPKAAAPTNGTQAKTNGTLTNGSAPKKHTSTAKPTTPPRELPPDEQAKVEAIHPNDVFDPSVHPRVGMNEEVTNSAGDTYRLATKRLGGRQRRVWLRVPHRLVAT